MILERPTTLPRERIGAEGVSVSPETAVCPTESGSGGVASFPPGYFAMVMATGVLAVGCHLFGPSVLAVGLAGVAAVAFLVILTASVARLIHYPRLLLADLTSHARGFAFTTAVAAIEVLGVVADLVFGWRPVAHVLWWAGVGLWPVLIYTTLIAVVLSADEPGIRDGINGTWFMLTVSTDSIAVLGALLIGDGDRALAFVCVMFFGLGAVLYLIVMTMVFLRWTLAPHGPAEEDPPTWIASGAVAITTLAGATLLSATTGDPFLALVAPGIALVTVVAWTTSTFWFPLMIAIGVWRHVVHRMPLRYHPSYWSLVFPLCMYAVATYRLRTALGLDFLAWLPPVALDVALCVWTATSAGLVISIVRGLSRARVGTRSRDDRGMRRRR